MELIRRNSDYALRALSLMARYPKGKRLTVNTIAARQGVPKEFLRKIFQKLSLNNILGSKLGPDGGYYLIKNPYNISIKDVIESVQGRVSLNGCLTDKNFCDRQDSCQTRKKLRNIQQQIDTLLSKSKLGDIV